MDKVTRLLKALDKVIKEEEEDLKDELEEFEGVDTVIKAINAYEKKIAKHLRNQKKYFIKGINEYIAKDVALKDLINYVMQDLTATDTFSEDMEESTKKFLEKTINELCTMLMDSIDKEVQFEIFSERTTEWIKSWSKDLSELMKLNTHKAIEDVLNKALEDGEGIPKVIDKLKELPEFDRKRAKTTAITEMLTAHSRSLWESFMQSPCVTEKTWKHSGGKGIKPRDDHVNLDGTSVAVDKAFYVGGEEAQYPRDPSLSAKQRVNCHCTMGPKVDQSIIKLSKEEKLKLREEALKEMGAL
ncbi:phage minor head protein [Clostridium sp. HMP27]|uniref:phage minor head protein n=1 Tax=Clostridium sp. HMP27 TaxID=1487921 RepID=UPI00052D4800|nr:phage minor head protein [Clostridium sp. HMP27]KGK88032.1 hypothetical protein DP68_08870 [Clostridium sp. HMP27]